VQPPAIGCAAHGSKCQELPAILKVAGPPPKRWRRGFVRLPIVMGMLGLPCNCWQRMAAHEPVHPADDHLSAMKQTKSEKKILRHAVIFLGM